MKAITQNAYGAPEDVLLLKEIDRPEVKHGEVLVRVHASSVAGDDWHLMQGIPYVTRMATGLRRPKLPIPGQDVAGTVEAIGVDVREFKAGDEVFGWHTGTFAEYASIPEASLALKPANLTMEEAAAVPIVGFTALQGLRDTGQLQPGQKVLINGASGGVGTFAVQIAKAFGAEVTGVASSRNLELLRSIGADHVIDYAWEDFTDGHTRYDLILDMVGNRPLSVCRRTLTPNGTLVMVGGSGGRWFNGTERWLQGLVLSPFVSQKLRPLIHSNSKDDLLALKEMIEAGKLTPVVSAHYPLSEAAKAIKHLGNGHGRGKVVLVV